MEFSLIAWARSNLEWPPFKQNLPILSHNMHHLFVFQHRFDIRYFSKKKNKQFFVPFLQLSHHGWNSCHHFRKNSVIYSTQKLSIWVIMQKVWHSQNVRKYCCNNLKSQHQNHRKIAWRTKRGKQKSRMTKCHVEISLEFSSIFLSSLR